MSKALFFLLVSIVIGCTQNKEIETESLHNQLLLNEQRNAEVIKKMTNTIEIRGNRFEELTFLEEVTNLMLLKKELGLNSNQIKNSSSYNLGATRTYIDTLAARFQFVDDSDKFIKLLKDTRLQLKDHDKESKNKDEYMHFLLQISYCETMLFSYYGSEIGVQELNWVEDYSSHNKRNFELDSMATGLNFKAQTNYASTKQKAKELRAGLAQTYKAATNLAQKEAILDSAQNEFASYLLNQIIPYWYNTEWGFDGYTSIPNRGSIACGYFVSTTLLHMGINVNRYKLAQQNPENEAKTVAIKDSLVRSYDYLDIEPAIHKELSTYDDGLYFVGLDYHVGYLYIRNGQAYFIHSDYVDGFVRIESIENSEAFESETYFISNISSNRNLALKWIMEEEVLVIREQPS